MEFRKQDIVAAMDSRQSDAATTPPSLALWLVPQEPLASDLRWWIDQLSSRLGGPRFDPHVTLLSSLPGGLSAALTLTERLAQRLPPVRIETEGIALLRHYFRAVVLPVFMSPSLWQAHLAAREAFEHRAVSEYGASSENRASSKNRDSSKDPPATEESAAGEDQVSFFPHLSLYYGEAPRATRIRLLDSLGEVPDLRFFASTIHLISAGPRPEKWEIVRSFPLKGLPRGPQNPAVHRETS